MLCPDLAAIFSLLVLRFKLFFVFFFSLSVEKKVPVMMRIMY